MCTHCTTFGYATLQCVSHNNINNISVISDKSLQCNGLKNTFRNRYLSLCSTTHPLTCGSILTMIIKRCRKRQHTTATDKNLHCATLRSATLHCAARNNIYIEKKSFIRKQHIYIKICLKLNTKS